MLYLTRLLAEHTPAAHADPCGQRRLHSHHWGQHGLPLSQSTAQGFG